MAINFSENSIKTWSEMTADERAALHIINGRHVEDYATFQIRRNVIGRLLSVTGYELTAAKKAALRAKSAK